MKKIGYILITLLLPAIALVLWLIFDQRQTPAWQIELEKYNAFQERSASIRFTQHAVDRATKPWKFTRSPGFIVYGDTPHYITDDAYGMDGGNSYNRMPLPYPPEELWCVLLMVKPIYAYDSPRLQMVFVARHQDMYNAAWVVHAAIQAAGSPELLQTMAVVGCQIDVSRPVKDLTAN